MALNDLSYFGYALKVNVRLTLALRVKTHSNQIKFNHGYLFQLILEKQKLIAMQLHLHLSEHKYSDLVC